MPSGYVRAMVQFAYIWGWPLINMVNRRAAITQAPHPGLLGGFVPAAPRGPVLRFCTIHLQKRITNAAKAAAWAIPSVSSESRVGCPTWFMSCSNPVDPMIAQSSSNQFSGAGSNWHARNIAALEKPCLLPTRANLARNPSNRN